MCASTFFACSYSCFAATRRSFVATRNLQHVVCRSQDWGVAIFTYLPWRTVASRKERLFTCTSAMWRSIEGLAIRSVGSHVSFTLPLTGNAKTCAGTPAFIIGTRGLYHSSWLVLLMIPKEAAGPFLRAPKQSQIVMMSLSKKDPGLYKGLLAIKCPCYTKSAQRSHGPSGRPVRMARSLDLDVGDEEDCPRASGTTVVSPPQVPRAMDLRRCWAVQSSTDMPLQG